MRCTLELVQLLAWELYQSILHILLFYILEI